jgi:hypothetical protein
MELTVAQLLELIKDMPRDAKVVIDNHANENYQFAYNVALGNDTGYCVIYVVTEGE